MTTFLIDPSRPLSLDQVADILHTGTQLKLSSEATQRIMRCRSYLDEQLAGESRAIYGINTGFGALCNTIIAPDALEDLQRNLLLSHACGMGEEVPEEIVKLMILLKIYALSLGHSGVQLDTVQRLIDFFNHGIFPVIYQQGSLGASGDLAPLAHLVLPLIGEGHVRVQGKVMAATEALAQFSLEKIRLKSKEGLALINGTQFMNAYLTLLVITSEAIADRADEIAALSLDAFDGLHEPFDPLIHSVRPHPGQMHVAERMRMILDGSEIGRKVKSHVQDPYCFRCIPQVHGASRDTFSHARRIAEIEMNAVTDNPIIFPEQNKIISGGNFHGQPLAIVLDCLAIALAEWGSISERRTYKLIGGQRGLPPFLASNPGLHSGFMIPQYTAAGIVSQNKQLCTPASVDTIDSSNGQEDHVSMGANAATKCLRVLENVKSLLAIEWLVAAQALDFRRPMKSSQPVEKLHANLRKQVPFVTEDVYQHEMIKGALKVLKESLRPV